VAATELPYLRAGEVEQLRADTRKALDDISGEIARSSSLYTPR
jgi:hypothetical protein